jgi:hypothetical protein
MIDREKVLELARDYIDLIDRTGFDEEADDATRFRQWAFCQIAKEFIAVDAELAALREQSRWIPVGERLPEKKVQLAGIEMVSCIVVTLGGLVCEGMYVNDHWEILGDIEVAITHWRPLPAPPESEE